MQTHGIVQPRPMRPDRADDEPLEMIVDCLVSEPELESLSEVLGGLISKGEEARQLRVCERKEDGIQTRRDG